MTRRWIGILAALQRVSNAKNTLTTLNTAAHPNRTRDVSGLTAQGQVSIIGSGETKSAARTSVIATPMSRSPDG